MQDQSCKMNICVIIFNKNFVKFYIQFNTMSQITIKYVKLPLQYNCHFIRYYRGIKYQYFPIKLLNVH